MTEAKPRIHLAYRRAGGVDTRCGTGSGKDITTDESLATCPLCLPWAHRGYTTPENVSKTAMRARNSPRPGQEGINVRRAVCDRATVLGASPAQLLAKREESRTLGKTRNLNEQC
jgi:hypothetical protein